MDRVKVKTEELRNWRAVRWEDNEWDVVHYVGGEDTDYECHGTYTTKEEAELEAHRLNTMAEPETYTWYRDWHG